MVRSGAEHRVSNHEGSRTLDLSARYSRRSLVVRDDSASDEAESPHHEGAGAYPACEAEIPQVRAPPRPEPNPRAKIPFRDYIAPVRAAVAPPTRCRPTKLRRRRSDERPSQARSQRPTAELHGRGLPCPHSPQPRPLYLAEEPARPEAARPRRHDAAARRQARHHRRALFLQVGDGFADRHNDARLDSRAAGRPRRADHRLWRAAHADAGVHARARRALRGGRHERGAPPRHGSLRAHARALPAVPPRAQDRRPDPRAGARPQRHRDAGAHDHAHRRADHRRIRADRRRVPLQFRLALRRRRHPDDRRLSVVHDGGHQLAHGHPQNHE